MRNQTIRRITGAGLAAATAAATLGLGAPLAGASSATPTHPAQAPNLAGIKARCDAAIATRETTLSDLEARVAASKHLTAGDSSSLTGQLQAAASGLTGLKASIDADATLAPLLADCRRIATEYRVYLLLVPKTRLVIAADRGLAALSAATDAEPKVDAAIAHAAAAGVPADRVADATAKASDLKAKVADASGQITGITAELVPLTAAQLDSGAARPVLDAARTHLQAVVADLQAVRADLQGIRTDLTTR